VAIPAWSSGLKAGLGESGKEPDPEVLEILRARNAADVLIDGNIGQYINAKLSGLYRS